MRTDQLDGTDAGGLLPRIQASRRQLAELVLTAGVLALGINLASDAIKDMTDGVGAWLALVIGVALSTLVLLGVLFTGPRRRRASYEGYVLVSASRGRLIPVPRYEFADAIGRQLPFVLDSVPEIRERWERAPEEVVCDAAEAFVLRIFSYTLDATFPLAEGAQGLVDLDRDDLQDVIGQNKVLDFLTNPAHLGIEMQDLVALMLPGGGLAFDRIRIRLPAGSKIIRTDDGILVKTRMCDVRMAVASDASGLTTREFEEHYLAADRTLRLVAHQVKIAIDVRFSLRAVLAGRRLWYYRWVDTFIERLDRDVSERRFYDDIAWEGALTVIDWLDGRVGPATRKLSLGPVTTVKEALTRASEILSSEDIRFETVEEGRLLHIRPGSSSIYLHALEATGVVLRLEAPVLQRVDDAAGDRIPHILSALNALNARLLFGRLVYRPEQAIISLTCELLAHEMDSQPLLGVLHELSGAADQLDDENPTFARDGAARGRADHDGPIRRVGRVGDGGRRHPRMVAGRTRTSGVGRARSPAGSPSRGVGWAALVRRPGRRGADGSSHRSTRGGRERRRDSGRSGLRTRRPTTRRRGCRRRRRRC